MQGREIGFVVVFFFCLFGSKFSSAETWAYKQIDFLLFHQPLILFALFVVFAIGYGVMYVKMLERRAQGYDSFEIKR